MSLFAASTTAPTTISRILHTGRSGRIVRRSYQCLNPSLEIPYTKSRFQQYTTPSHNIDIIRDCDVQQFYRYTSGRWLWNEKYQLARRYVKFDLPGLLYVSTQTLGAQSCVKVEKLPKGNFNKVFLITMDDGREVIAKLPNPNSGRPHYTTASEVATMDYVRNILGVPAPRVYDWSSSTDNPVKAEYILMERSEGVELDTVWDGMPWEERLGVVRTLVGYEKASVSASLPMYGSLYYAKDVDSPHASQYLDPSSIDRSDAFVVGPTTNRTFFDQERHSVEVNRGPWHTLNEYIHSRAARELACINAFSSYPSQQGLFNGPHQYCPTKSLKLKVLQDYLKIATKILPQDTNLSTPTLWHPDLHTSNIFVDPTHPINILSIIDWQAVNLSALFLQARHPSLIEFEGPIPEGLQPIHLPENFDALSEEEKLRAKNLRAAQSLYKLYEILMLRQCPDVARALRFKESLPGQITGLASSVFSDGEPVLQGMLMRLQDEWDACVGSTELCPLSFTAEERMEQQRLEASWGEGVELMDEVLTEVGAYQGWEGWANHNDYDLCKERLERCRKRFLERYAGHEEERRAWEEVWPFEDKMRA